MQVLIGGKQAVRLSRDGPFNVSLGPAEAFLGADTSRDEEVRLDIIVEGLFRSNEGWRFDTKGLASPHVQWNGVEVTPSSAGFTSWNRSPHKALQPPDCRGPDLLLMTTRLEVSFP